MANGTVHMTVGSNIGKILLDIAQEAISKGDIEKAFRTYEESLHGIQEEHIIGLLTNKYVIEASKDGTMVNMTDNPKAIKANKANLYDWKTVIKSLLKEISDYLSAIAKYKEKGASLYIDVDDFPIMSYMHKRFGEEGAAKMGIGNLLAKVLKREEFAYGLCGNGSGVWERLIHKVETSDNAEDYETIFYTVYQYVECIRYLHESYMKLAKIYPFLLEKGMIDKVPFIEVTIEGALQRLKEFANPNKGYHHSMCDEQISDYKNQIIDDLLKTEWGKEYLRYGILAKDLMDGYDAGYLSPDGLFYGGNGSVSSMIHMNLADDLVKKYGDSIDDKYDMEHKLTCLGFLKIHHDEIYGFFKFRKNDDDDERLFAPTEIQIKMICEYAKKFYNGTITTAPRVTGAYNVKVSNLAQMDEFALHEAFSIH